MAFVASLKRQRQILGNLGKKFRQSFKSNPMVEALEPRALFSMVPTGNDPTTLGVITHSTQVVAATASDGQHMVAWLGTQNATTGIFYDVLKSDGTVTGATTFIAVASGVTDFKLTVNNGVGAIAWLSSDVIHAQRIDLSTAALSGSEATITAANSTHISDFDIVLDSSANLAALWAQAATYSIKPTSTATAQNFTSNSLFLAVNASGGTTWTTTTTIVDAATRVGDGKLGDIEGIDINVGTDNKFIAAWQASTLSFVYDDAFGNYTAQITKLDTSFRKYTSAGATSGDVVLVGSKTATNAIKSASIQISTDSKGTFTISQNVAFYVTRAAGSSSEQTYNVLTIRSYETNAKDGKHKALSLETEVARTDTHSQITGFSAAYDGSHNLMMTWQVLGNESETSTVYAQSYTTKSAKVGVTSTLNINLDSHSNLDDVTLLASSAGFRLVYFAYNSNAGSVSGSILSQDLGDALPDLSVAIGTNTLKPTIKSGTTAISNLPVIITNNGGTSALGTATIMIQLVPVNSSASTVTLATLSGQILNIAAGKSKTYTIKNLTISPSAYTAEGDYMIVAKIVEVTAGANVNTTNDSASVGLKVIGANATYSDLQATSISTKFTQTVLVPGDTGTISVVLRNSGTSDIVAQTVVLNISASTDGQFNEDLQLVTKTLTLSLKAGASTTITLPVAITQALTRGSYQFVAQISPSAPINDENSTDDIAATSASTNVVWEFGNVVGRKNATSLTWTNTDGSKVTYSLSGAGYAEIEYNDSDLPGLPKDQAGSILNLSYIETNSTSKISITLGKGATSSTLGNITGYAEIGSLTATSTNLLGNANLKGITTLTLGDISASAAQEINIDSTLAKAVTITLGKANSLMLKSDQAINKLTASDWSGSGAYLETSTIGTLSITGNAKKSIVGNLKANVVLTGLDKDNNGTADTGVTALGTLSVAGKLDHTVIRTAGNITSITAGAADAVSILAGVASGVQDVLTSSPTKLLPTSNTDFADLYSKIGSVTFKGKIGTTATASTDYYIAAGSIGAMSLGLTKLGTATTYGVAVLANSTTPPVTTAYKSVSLSYLDGSNKTVSTSFTAKDQATKLPALTTALHFTTTVLTRPGLSTANTTMSYASDGFSMTSSDLLSMAVA